MIDWYRHGPENSKWTQTHRKMVDRYKCDPKNSNWNWQNDDQSSGPKSKDN